MSSNRRIPLHRMAPLLVLLPVVCALGSARADDWPRFRGGNGSGVSPETVPTSWSDTENLGWKAELPGPGSSCPIVVGNRVLITCWSGYGVDRQEPGEMANLKRHLIAFDKKTGKRLWSADVPAVLPEDRYRGMFAEHGYASHTPVSDGTHVFAYFGKTGLIAFDLKGNELWRKSLGTGSDPRGWGSASSPVLVDDLVIATGSAESRTLAAFEKKTGREVWKQQADGLEGTWGTPVVVPREDGEKDIVLAVPYELWALNAKTGKLRWYCESVESDSMCSSAIVAGNIVFTIEGRSGGGVAVRGGGKGDVGKSHVVWRNSERGRISTPVVHDEKIYFVASKILNVLDAKTGERIRQTRLSGSSDAGGGGRGAGGRGGGRGGGFGGQDYSSPVIAGGKLYFFSRRGEAFVAELGDEPKVIATNRFASDTSSFSATPAISDGALYVRSDRFLYCISESK